MLSAHQPKKVLFQFGGNMIGLTDTVVTSQVDQLMRILGENGVSPRSCYFLTPTFEMEVDTRRNVPRRTLSNVQHVSALITKVINGRCQLIDGIELMKDSPYFDGKELLRRVIIPGMPGCGGAAVNDNVHICGEAARDMAQRVCDIVNANAPQGE